MRYISICLTISCCLLLCLEKVSAEDGSFLRKQVHPISVEIWNRPSPKGKVSDDMKYMLRQNNKYTLNKWSREIKRFQEQTGEYFDFGGKTEHFIVPFPTISLLWLFV